MKPCLSCLMFCLLNVAASAETQQSVGVIPLPLDCVRLADGSAPPADGDSEPTVNTSVTLQSPSFAGDQYSLSHGVGNNAGCQLVFNPALPGAPDDVVTFDNVPEQTRTDVFGNIPIVTETEQLMPNNQTQVMIESHSMGSQPLFPPNQFNQQGQPLNDACYLLGYTNALQSGQPIRVVQATITFLRFGTPVAGPFDITGSSYFASPWNGVLGLRLPGGAGSPLNINQVRLQLVCEPDDPECFTDEDCDDGDMCTVDKCINNVCVHIPLKDTLTREEALRASHGPAKACFEDGGCPGLPFGEPTPNHRDPWVTPDLCDGSTQWRIGLDAGDMPIPEEFFGPGSQPFTGAINFKGLPLGLPEFADSDTVIRRFGDPLPRSAPVSPTPVTIEIEIIQLSLVSCNPITVTYAGGATSMWNVKAELSECPPPRGTITATKTHCNGGTYTSELNVQPKVIFTRVGDPSDIRVLDTGCTSPPFPFDALSSPEPTSWVHDIAPNLCVADDFASAFHPGLPDGQSTACGDFDMDDDCDSADFSTVLSTYGKSYPDPAYRPRVDYNADGVIGFFDIQEWLHCYRCSSGSAIAVPAMLGDMDGDGMVRGPDIQPFTRCVTGGGTPSIDCMAADMNENGLMDYGDVPGFVAALMDGF